MADGRRKSSARERRYPDLSCRACKNVCQPPARRDGFARGASEREIGHMAELVEARVCGLKRR